MNTRNLIVKHQQNTLVKIVHAFVFKGMGRGSTIGTIYPQGLKGGRVARQNSEQ
jgi:hypothetical protein